nr:unnamed protein product [Callosobruchus analis]
MDCKNAVPSSPVAPPALIQTTKDLDRKVLRETLYSEIIQRHRREWQRDPNTESHRSFTEARSRSKRVIDSSKEEHNQKIKNKLLSRFTSSRTFWSVAKPVSKNFPYSSVPPLTREDKSSTPKEKARTLRKLFATNSTADFQGNTPAAIITYTQLLKYLDNNSIIHDRQYGFRKHRSACDLLAYVTHVWNRAIENHGKSRVIALDISKAFNRAFNSVWHEELLTKLAAQVQFKVQKPQATTLTKKSHVGLPTVELERRIVVESPSVKLLGININNNMKLYTPEQLLLLYKAQIRPSLEYCSLVWVCAPKHSLKLLGSIQNRTVRLLDASNLTKDLHSLEHRRSVASLSLFYRLYHGRCLSELSQVITPKAV